MPKPPNGYEVNYDLPEMKRLMPPDDYIVEIVENAGGFPFTSWEINPKYLRRKQ